MNWFYLLIGSAFSMIALGTILLFSGLFIQSGTDATVFSTSGGILLATAGWLLTSAITLRMKIRDVSLKYLEQATARMAKSGELNRLWLEYNIDDYIITDESREYFYIHNALTHPVLHCIRDIANTYEYMGIAIEEGAVEEKMMRRSFATNLRWFWPRLELFLDLFRNNPVREGHPHGKMSNPLVFSHCKALAKKWDGKEI